MTNEDSPTNRDMATTMALLWGTRPAPSRGRKPGMTINEIVATAVAIADADGLGALSMRRVADALGVGTMSLYRYLPGKAELYALMLDAVMGEGQPEPDAHGWRENLENVARRSLDGYRRHPWLLDTSLSRGLVGPNQAAVLDKLLAMLAGTGLTNGRKMAVIGLLTGYVQGRARQFAEAARTQHRSGASDAQFWQEFAPLLDPHLDRFPTLAAVWRDDELTWEDEFEFGLQRVLDGIETYIDEGDK
ncbi:TetR/AcrR family transcriptional regulator [Actinophytocola sp.]|uniref:TetR/AcrR family transcriptional regulator n=1 Tax=Actinophytocola sp. TaxID=1872138 RepID=UPI00389A8BD3